MFLGVSYFVFQKEKGKLNNDKKENHWYFCIGAVVLAVAAVGCEGRQLADEASPDAE